MGDRSEASCEAFRETIEKPYRKCLTVSDFWKPYAKVFRRRHRSCGKDTGETAHVERKNNVVRQRLGRFVRRTLSFSKKAYNHAITFYVFVLLHNLWLSSQN
jgi:insertion element IS1 protein InsB